MRPPTNNQIKALALCLEISEPDAQQMLESSRMQWPFYWATIAPAEQADATISFFRATLAQLELGIAQRKPTT